MLPQNAEKPGGCRNAGQMEKNICDIVAVKDIWSFMDCIDGASSSTGLKWRLPVPISCRFSFGLRGLLEPDFWIDWSDDGAFLESAAG